MKAKTKISALQLYMMLFLSRAIAGVTLNAGSVGGENFLENIFSSLLHCAVLCVFALPLFSLNRTHPDLSLPAVAELRMGAAGTVISALYAVFFLVSNAFALSLFITLLFNTMDPIASRFSVALALLAIAVYGAVKGIETVSRAAICVTALFLLGLTVICIALLPNVRPEYTKPVFQNGTEQFWRGAIVFAARSSSLAEFAVLMPFAAENTKGKFALWNISIPVFLGILLFFTVSCLGEYAYLQIFPIYTLSSIAEIAGVQRLDALFIGLCLMALVVRLAVGFFAISESCARFVRKTESRALLLGGAALLTLMLSLWVTADYERFREIFRAEFLLILTAVFGAVLPCFLWIVDRAGRGGGLR